MGLFGNKKKEGSLADIIRCDEPSYLIWKWHPADAALGESAREYSIRMGSQIRVKDGEVAVFVYRNQLKGTMQDYIVGPCDATIRTLNLPVLSNMLGKLFGGDTPFQAEVYYINLAGIIQVKFVVPFFDVCDYRYPDFAVPVAVRGTISFKIEDYQSFIKLHRLDTFTLETFQTQIKDAVSRYTKDKIANIPSEFGISVVNLASKLAIVNDAVERDLKARLQSAFGVIVSGVDIGAIDVDKTCSAYAELSSITKNVTAEAVQARTAADNENYRETLRIQREEGQYAMHKQTETANLAAYQIEKQADVGIAGANALGQMGANNAGGVNLGNNTGFNPASMMASMAVGGVVGQNIATVMGNTMSQGAAAPTAPPLIPTSTYHIAKDGRSTGPFDMTKLAEMAATGELMPHSLVWCQGMAAWTRADSVEDLRGLFPPRII